MRTVKKKKKTYLKQGFLVYDKVSKEKQLKSHSSETTTNAQ